MLELTPRRLRVAIMLLAFLVQPALAELDAQPTVVMVPAECLSYWTPQRGLTYDWNRTLSLAACLQDTSVEAIDDPARIPSLVDRLADRLLPSLSFYAIAVENGPGPVKLRAVYQLGMAELSLIVRARMSVRAPELRPRLEERLAPYAEIAMLAFASVVQVGTNDPTMAPDPVTRYMIRNARLLLEQLAIEWPERK